MHLEGVAIWFAYATLHDDSKSRNIVFSEGEREKYEYKKLAQTECIYLNSCR